MNDTPTTLATLQERLAAWRALPKWRGRKRALERSRRNQPPRRRRR